MSFIGFIPAREGSIRLPNKNLKLIKSRPLIYYSIFASQNSKYINETVVFSDSDKINSVAKKFGANSSYKRPKNISKKNTSMYETINYFVKKNNIQKKFKYLVLLQPTSPLRNTKDINKACKILLQNKNADGLISTFVVKNLKKEYPNKFMVLNGNYLVSIDKEEIFKKKKKFFLRNGPAILILKIKAIKKNLYENRLLNFIMPEKRSVDINFQQDLDVIKKII